MRLVYESTGEDVKAGDRTETFRGEPCTVKYIVEPHKSASTGRVCLEFSDWKHEYFPGVIGAKWIDRGEDR